MNPLNIQIQVSQQTPSGKSIKKNHINAYLIKLLKASDKGGKKGNNYRATKNDSRFVRNNVSQKTPGNSFKSIN